MKTKLYGFEKQETIMATSWDEAINEAIENNKEFPIKIFEFEREDPFGDTYHDNFLENLLEDLDQEHGDPDGDWTKPTKKMKEAAKAFIEVMKEEYQSFWLVKTGKYRIYSNDSIYKEYIETNE